MDQETSREGRDPDRLLGLGKGLKSLAKPLPFPEKNPADFPSVIDLSLRPVTDADHPLLLRIYASSREQSPDLIRRHPDSRRQIIEHEFHGRQDCYPLDFPGVEFFVIERNSEAVGRLYLQDTPRWLFVVDLILLPEWRRRGYGSALLGSIGAEAAASGRTVRLHVEKQNAEARRLYDRLGFQPIEDIGQHLLLECRP